jgi:hypothetical protein
MDFHFFLASQQHILVKAYLSTSCFKKIGRKKSPLDNHLQFPGKTHLAENFSVEFLYNTIFFFRENVRKGSA